MSAVSVNQFSSRGKLVGLTQVDAKAKAHGYPDCPVVEFEAACCLWKHV